MRKPRSVVLLAAIAALSATPVALALAATPTAPVVSTAAPTSVTDTGAILHGAVNPEGQQVEYAFQWGPTAGYGHETPFTQAGAGSSSVSASATLANLSPGSTYHFRAIALNASGGLSVGGDRSFKTTGTAPAPSAVPLATTGVASNVGQSGATLGGIVNPKAQATTYYFEYGTSTGYGFETAPVSAGAGSADVNASANVSGLASSTTYHFRLIAVNAGGTTLGADQTLKTTTRPPAVSTGGASKADASSAVLSAIVNPEAQSTTYYFQFGTTTAYGLETVPVSVGSGTANVYVHRHPQGLIANTTYHYRVVAQNAAGISYGADRTIRTTGPTQTPSRLKVLGRMGFVSRSGWVGPVIGCFGGQTQCTGRYTLTYRSTVIGERNFSIAAASGWPMNVRLNSQGRYLFGRQYRRSVLVQLTITTTSGRQTSEAFSLARWQ